MSKNDSPPAFYSLDQYPELRSIVEGYAEVLEEVRANQTWLDWGSDDYDPSGHCNFLKGEWTVCPVYFGNYSPDMVDVPGMPEEELRPFLEQLPERFPATTALLRPLGRVNFAALSRLHPRSRLQPHTHFNPVCLILHVGLVIPEGGKCGLKVSERTYIWTQPGQAVLFDDNLEHSAWNDSDEERIVLYVDVTR